MRFQFSWLAPPNSANLYCGCFVVAQHTAAAMREGIRAIGTIRCFGILICENNINTSTWIADRTWHNELYQVYIYTIFAPEVDFDFTKQVGMNTPALPVHRNRSLDQQIQPIDVPLLQTLGVGRRGWACSPWRSAMASSGLRTPAGLSMRTGTKHSPVRW